MRAAGKLFFLAVTWEVNFARLVVRQQHFFDQSDFYHVRRGRVREREREREREHVTQQPQEGRQK